MLKKKKKEKHKNYLYDGWLPESEQRIEGAKRRKRHEHRNQPTSSNSSSSGKLENLNEMYIRVLGHKQVDTKQKTKTKLAR